MGGAEQLAQVQAVATDPSAIGLIVVILGALFTLIGGGYIFTWLVFMEMRKVTRDLWKAVTKVTNHDYHELKARISKLERRDP